MSHQLALSWGAACDGMRRSAEHAENVEPGWCENAYRLLCDYRPGVDFTSEQFRDHLASVGFEVPVPKALGAIFKKAARRMVIQRVGFAPSKERHCSPTPLWRKA